MSFGVVSSKLFLLRNPVNYVDVKVVVLSVTITFESLNRANISLSFVIGDNSAILPE